MIFRQLFEPDSSTYTYLLACPETSQAVLVDPVIETIERDLAVLGALDVRLAYTVETHVHADHLTSAWILRDRTGCQVACPAAEGVPCADLHLGEKRPLTVGHLVLLPLRTPGHTTGHHCYLLQRAPAMVFTGDALLVDGCGRTDLEGGDAAAPYRSVHDKLFTLPDDTLVYPGHDYNQRRVSIIAQERARNQRLKAGTSFEEFTTIMGALELPRPKNSDIAVSANRACHRLPDCPRCHREGPNEDE